LMNAHLPDDMRKKGKRNLDHRMKTNKTTNSGIHFLNWKGGMSASKIEEM